MAGDRARVSYDPSRKWRGLIAQQGRVTVEATRLGPNADVFVLS